MDLFPSILLRVTVFFPEQAADKSTETDKGASPEAKRHFIRL